MIRIPLPSMIRTFIVTMFLTAYAHGATVTFRVTVPGATPASDTVYIAGNFQGWNPGSPAHALARQSDGRWQITLTFPDNVGIQFKFTRGSWATVEKGPNGEEIPNRAHTPQGTQTLNLTVANWADIAPSTIVGHVESFQFAPFRAGRRCWVYLPPGYFESTAHYPVLYMHDGQNLFDQATSFAGEWKVDEACESLIAAGEIEPIIVVGIENAGAGRCNEYTPWFRQGGACNGGGADSYLQAIRDTLIPEINRRYRAQTGPGNTAMCGSSLGGLVTTYAGYALSPWGRIAAVSPSYWFRRSELFDFATQRGRPPNLERFYQDMGTGESGNIDELRDMRDIALAQGFVQGDDFLSVEAQGHTHNEYYWSLRFPNILRFLFDPPASCTADFDGDGFVTGVDFDLFVSAFEAGEETADFDGNGFVNGADFDEYVEAYDTGC